MKPTFCSIVAVLLAATSALAQTHPAAQARRFTRGVPNDLEAFTGTAASYQSAVIPADQQRGIELSPTGNNAALYGGLPETQLPWFCRVQRTTRYHLGANLQTGELAYGQIENPIVAFGELGGGTPLYINRDYRFGVFAGFRDYTNPADPLRGIFRILAYARTALASGQTNVAPADQTTFELPWPGDANWDQFLRDGARKVVPFQELTTTIEIVGGATAAGHPEQWNTWNDPFVLTHRASGTNYYYVVEYLGWSNAGADSPMVTSSVPASRESATYSPLYALDFVQQPAWRSTFLHAPQFAGEPAPASYYGKSFQELQALAGAQFTPSTPPDALKTATGLDSAELRTHPILEEFVDSMGGDAVALANFVFNEIELTDPVSYNEEGGMDEASIHCGGVNRGALATFLERQGNPWEQCALLVYLLRRANVAAVYCEPEKDKLGMLDSQLGTLLRMRIKEAKTPDGRAQMPQVVATNYPWVAAWIPGPGTPRWVHLFPWLKDTEVVEGGNLYDQLPAAMKSGAAWVRGYLQADSAIVPEQVAVYQQDPGADGLVVIEAEGFHEHISKGGKRWEPSDGSGPSGYSGASWMRAVPDTGTVVSSGNLATQSPRLDYEVNFTRTGTHYLQVRGQDDNPNNTEIYLGEDGEVSTATAIPAFGATYAWQDTVRTVNIPSAGRHTINVWMGADGARLDKLVITSNASYLPLAAGAPGPALSKQTPVEPNVPSNLFPRYARANLGAETSFESLGIQFRDRRYNRTEWEDFPRPFALESGTHLFFSKLEDRENTFDTVRVQLWSDRNRNGTYESGSDGPYFSTGDWRSCDLHNRRFFTSCRKTGSNTHQLRLYLAAYQPGISGTGNFGGADRLPEQLLTANLTSADDALQFEITHQRQKRASKFGLASINLTNPGTGYTTAPTVTIAAPPAGTGHRPALATAQVFEGQVFRIVLTDPGYGYTTAPAVTITPNGAGSGAQAASVLQDGVRWVHPLGVWLRQSTTQKPSIRKGELAALCLNFGRVTDEMLRVQAQDFWAQERALEATPSLKDDADFQERMQSISAYLMGMSYYNRVSRFKEVDERLHKARIFSMYAAGLSKLAPDRKPDLAFTAPTFGLPNDGDLIPKMATVDMFFLSAAYAANGTVHADSGIPFTEATRDFWRLLIAEISAQEHGIINDYYRESAAISTIKLLQRATELPAGIRRLTKANYATEGATNYTFGTTTKTLSAWDPAMWQAIVDVFAPVTPTPDSDFAEVFITPGPVASASASYTGMGAMVFTNNRYSALISGNMQLSNGGSGSSFVIPLYDSSYLPNITLNSSGGDYSLSYGSIGSVSYPAFAPATSSVFDAVGVITSLNSVTSVPTSYQSAAWSNNAALYGWEPAGYGTYYSNTLSVGSAGETSYFGALGSAVSTVVGWVSDPVSVVTGEFHIDAVDLTLPGPMPLSIRRNYSSQALTENEFGHGWKLAYFPYLVVGENDRIYGAEMDGSVIAYRQDPVDTNLYVPTPADNPSLRNLHDGGAGSTGNPLLYRLRRTTEGADTIYTLSGPHGQTRRFKVRSFAVGSISRTRPYLETWEDANGNTLIFTFYDVPTDPRYGQLKQISANNGSFVGFDYDVVGHIVEAWTGDGRRVKYSYDAQGDLRTVILPDGAVHTYDYQQVTSTSGGESLQTSEHLLIRETKPDGRILENTYDSQRRVTEQRAVVDRGTTAPVTNATFVYANTQDPTTKTWSGTTTVRDAYDRPTVFTYSASLVTSEDDPETPAELREWYPADATPGSNGAYPRSLKQIADRRGVVTFFKYDARGNLIEKSIGTDASPADLDGDGTAASGEKAVTTWTYNGLDLPLTQNDPSGVVTMWFYEDASYPYLATRIEKHAQGQLVSKVVRSFYEKTGTPSAYGLLQSERVAADAVEDEAQTTWTHDSHGFPSQITRLTGTADPAVVTDVIYSGRGELIKETDASGATWHYGYDPLGRRISEERREGSTLLAWNYTYFTRNGEVDWMDGQRAAPEDWIKFRYDAHGRKIEELRWRSQAKADGTGVEAPVGDALASTTFFQFDKFNNLTETRTPRRNSITMAYDGVGRMTGRDFYEGYFGDGGVLKASESFTYEPGGQVNTHTDVLGGVTTMLHNARGQLRHRTNPDGSVEQWRYYLDGRLYREILRNGSFWETTYDDFHRTVTRQLKNSGGTVLKTQEKKYDRRGNCTSETADGFTFTSIYDDLNRVKTVTGPAASGTSAQQVTNYAYPDGAGRETRVANGKDETEVTLRDALGRKQSVEVRAPDHSLVRKTAYAYSGDHHSVTVTEGTGAGAIVTQTWTDTFGNPVLIKKANGSAEIFSYDNGGSLTKHERKDWLSGSWSTASVRNWRGDVTQETRPGNLVVNYVRDAAGNLLQRNMPGGLSEQAQYDSAGRVVWSKLVQGANTTRRVDYAYYPDGDPREGLLATATDARGIVVTTDYDDALRQATQTSTGPDPEDAFSRTLTYNERDLVTSIAETGLHGSTTVARAFDGYGALGSEAVSVGGTPQSELTQWFDEAGRRWELQGAGGDRTFAHRADGLMLSTTMDGKTYGASYGDHGLLTSRTSDFRTVTVYSRDTLGRVTDLRTTVGGVQVLRETAYRWDDRGDKLVGLSITRAGAGAWSENRRDYAYDGSGRLTYEDFRPYPELDREEWYYTYYDASGIGVRSRTRRGSGDEVSLHLVPSVADFARVTSEQDASEPRPVNMSGTALGANSVALTLDARPVSGVSFPGWQDSQGQWTAAPKLATGQHRLTATATHPSGWVAPSVSHSFYVMPQPLTISTVYGEMGNVASRNWSNGKAQTLTWDARGRLLKVVQTGMNPFTWTALYDGLNRRIRTTYTPQGGSEVTTKSVFDPEVEFLELGLAIGENWNWKVYGPDLSGTYGGLQGLGGLEAVIGSDGTTRGIVNDWWGNAVGHVATPGGAMTWSSAQFLAWGPAPGWGTAPLDGTKPLYELLGYRGLTVDPPGYVHQGLRDYYPQVGRWLSPDPLGHVGSLSLYDYCDNDPLNVFDPDGRFGKQALSGSAVYLDAFNNTFYGTIGGAAKAADWVSETFVGTPNLGAGIANWADSNMDLGLKMGWYQETDASIAIKTGFGIAAAMVAPESRIATAGNAARGVETVAVGAARTQANTTRLGITRNNPAAWRETRDLWDQVGYSDILSDTNRAAIARGRTPIVDEAWISYFPEDAGLLGERISMHHVGGGPITVPLPFSRHVDAHMPGGFGNNPGGPGSALPIYPRPNN